MDYNSPLWQVDMKPSVGWKAIYKRNVIGINKFLKSLLILYIIFKLWFMYICWRSNVEDQRTNVKADLPNILSLTELNRTIQHEWKLSTEVCIYIYSALLAAVVTLSLSSILCLFTICKKASIKLHTTMFGNIIHAAISFFSSKPSGHYM